MKLLLVYPKIECSVTSTSTYSLPLGLGSIATYCKEHIGELEIKILDGSLMSHEEQLEETERFQPDITGINPTIASQKNGYELGELAKNLDSVVIFGGVNSTNLWKNILKNRRFIDGVVLYDGEMPMFFILNRLKEREVLGKQCFEGIPNLGYMDDEEKIRIPSLIYIPCLDELSDIDYSLFDLDNFFEQTTKKGFGRAVTYYAGKGCAKRGGLKASGFYSFDKYCHLVSQMDVCSFCGRNELGSRNFNETREEKIVRDLYEQHKITGFFNVQDTVNLRNTSPIGINSAWFRLFIGTESITPKNIDGLKRRYGQNLIFQAGIEAANPQMRQVFGKQKTDLEDVLSKVKIMREEGIQLHASFILGGRGETKEFMHRTTEVARKIAEYDNVTWVLISPQLILPGSPDFRALLQMPRMQRKYGNEDLIDIKKINQDFLEQFSPDLTREEIVEEIKKTFGDIRKTNKKIVLDVKGIVSEEEKFIDPGRQYAIT